MTSSRQPARRLSTFRWLLPAAAILLHVGSSISWAEVTLTADPDYPDFPGVFTLDPEAFSPAVRNIAADRNLRQTFTNTETFDVGGMVLSLAIDNVDGGLNVELFEVDDVLADEWSAGTSVASFTFDSTALIETNDRLGITLTDGDVFSLPARTAPAGYGLQLSNTDGTTNIGAWRHSNSGTDHYADGIFYDESGFPPESYRDTGVALLDADAGLPTPGDVDGDDIVDTDDLDIIAANFRQGAALRTQGDLTGDSVVDLFDFREWKANYPDALPASFNFRALVQVPEPATLLPALAAFGACLTICRRRGN